MSKLPKSSTGVGAGKCAYCAYLLGIDDTIKAVEKALEIGQFPKGRDGAIHNKILMEEAIKSSFQPSLNHEEDYEKYLDEFVDQHFPDMGDDERQVSPRGCRPSERGNVVGLVRDLLSVREQYANRLAHLYLLHEVNGVDAWLDARGCFNARSPTVLARATQSLPFCPSVQLLDDKAATLRDQAAAVDKTRKGDYPPWDNSPPSQL